MCLRNVITIDINPYIKLNMLYDLKIYLLDKPGVGEYSGGMYRPTDVPFKQKVFILLP